MPESDEPTALYRYFDADDVLLYVGISNKPDFRAKAHLYESRRDDWPKRAGRRTDEWHASRPLALKAEEVAIKTEKPLYNGTHNHNDAEFDPSSWSPVSGSPKPPLIADLMRCEIISGRWPAGVRIPSLRTLAKAAGVGSSGPASKAAALLKAEGLLTFEAGHGLFVSKPRAVRPRPRRHAPAEPKTYEKLPHDWPRSVGFPG
ncbi:hypothetical protein GCM10009837_07130 [Streptomyces durmitorensis]|uniref:GntR family transcriptional regulator n=1 Tax=Streptomyces durmitorensis TaxID=319947 RepID=A0ABY4PKT3_9ACTN|nr:GntR family transcriptional regulator [Streptomyces durmitorensis]UQT54392.1 GntR family transcriptional regulator [Streptomyces durmitorensis]